MRGSKLMGGSSSWHASRPVRALIAVGLAIIGAVLVWAALARPSTSDSGLTGAPNGHIMPPMSPSAPKPTRTSYSASRSGCSGPDHGVGSAGV